MKNNIKLFTIFLFGATVAFADNEVFDDLTISGKDILGGTYKNSSWVGTTIKSSTFTGTKFNESNFSSAKIYESNFEHADISDSIFDGVEFNKVNFVGSTAKNTSFKKAKMGYSSVSFKSGIFDGSDFSEAVLSKSGMPSKEAAWSASFENSSLIGANFNKAKLITCFSTTTSGWTNWITSSADFSGADLTGANFSDTRLVTSYTTTRSVYVNFSRATLRSVNFTNAILGDDAFGLIFANYDLSDTNFTNAVLTRVWFKDSIITNVNFSNARKLTTSQLSETANYKNKDLSGIKFNGLDLTDWNLYGQNLQNTSFNGANLTGVNACYADMRGSDLSGITGSLKTQNTIWAGGIIKNFSMESASDNFTIRKYIPATSGGEMISAKVSESDATVSGGATLKLDTGARLDVVNKKTLTIAENGVLVIDTSLSDPTQIYIESLAGLVIDGKLTVNITEDLLDNVEYRFDLISFESDSNIASLKDLKPDESLYLTIKGKTFNGYWSCEINENKFTILATQVPEPATVAAIFGALALGLAVYRKRR